MKKISKNKIEAFINAKTVGELKELVKNAYPNLNDIQRLKELAEIDEIKEILKYAKAARQASKALEAK